MSLTKGTQSFIWGK